ncbi:MAG: 5-(carboxyamino)imidazole ribonucleotide synthase [Acidimicrobiia bacterium]
MPQLSSSARDRAVVCNMVTRLLATPMTGLATPLTGLGRRRCRGPDATNFRPVTTIAVLGGGQLGRMLGLAGIPLGVGFRFLDPVAGAPAAAVGSLTVGALDDERAVAATIAGSDVVTYEWEGVPAASARFAARTAPVHPGPAALEVSQDRLHEKALFREVGVDTAAFRAVDSRGDLHAAADALGLPAVLKTRRGGYDGKGQVRIDDLAALDAAWDALGGTPLLLEVLVPFDRELSIVGVRSRGGETACWALAENHHVGGILHTSRAPAPSATPTLQQAAEELLGRILDRLGYVGVLAIELFQVGDGLLANEMAPRVHNSGHWTIDGSVTSQFENHVRAVLGLPLGSTAATGPSVMVNLLGAMPDHAALLAVDGLHLHDYGKSPRPGRKLGHVTLVGAADLDARLATVLEIVGS